MSDDVLNFVLPPESDFDKAGARAPILDFALATKLAADGHPTAKIVTETIETIRKPTVRDMWVGCTPDKSMQHGRHVPVANFVADKDFPQYLNLEQSYTANLIASAIADVAVGCVGPRSMSRALEGLNHRMRALRTVEDPAQAQAVLHTDSSIPIVLARAEHTVIQEATLHHDGCATCVAKVPRRLSPDTGIAYGFRMDERFVLLAHPIAGVLAMQQEFLCTGSSIPWHYYNHGFIGIDRSLSAAIIACGLLAVVLDGNRDPMAMVHFLSKMTATMSIACAHDDGGAISLIRTDDIRVHHHDDKMTLIDLSSWGPQTQATCFAIALAALEVRRRTGTLVLPMVAAHRKVPRTGMLNTLVFDVLYPIVATMDEDEHRAVAMLSERAIESATKNAVVVSVTTGGDIDALSAIPVPGPGETLKS